MKMEKALSRFWILLLVLVHGSMAQLIPSESRILLQVKKYLEYPEALNGWNRWTEFCFLPPSSTSSFHVNCSGGHVTELTIIGNKTKSSPNSPFPGISSVNSNQSSTCTLSAMFSLDSFFTLLTKLSGMQKLSLVSLGLWGPLPPKVSRFTSLQVLNMSSNFIYGSIPPSITSLKNLRTLVLADNLINGSIPDLSALQNLQELDLSLNQIGPEFPSLGENHIVSSILLRNNSLRCEIPSQFKEFNRLERLDVSSNHLLGPIPSFIFSLPALSYLNLAGNQLTGAIQKNTTCGNKLSYVDISSNLLKGSLPSCIVAADHNAQMKVFSGGNCLSGVKDQHSVSSCQTQALAVEPPSRNNNDQNQKQQQTTGIRLGVALGIIGGIIGLVVVGAFLIVGFLRIRSTNNENKKILNKPVTGTTSYRASPPIVDYSTSKYVPRTMRNMPIIGLPPYRVFIIEELEEATNNFDTENLIGEVPLRRIYRGMLESGSAVVIESISLKQKHSARSLNQHMEVLSHLRHQNLVSILGHCIVFNQDRANKGTSTSTSTNIIFLVFQYIPNNGSLRDHLTDRRRRDALKWPQRMTISLGIAKGVHFLHVGMTPGIFGNGLKIGNILLDETLTPKVSQYNIPLPSEIGKRQRSSTGQDTSDAAKAEKDDIYQLGIILLEILTGKQANSESEQEELKLELERSLAGPASVLEQAVDSSLRGTFAYQSLRTAADITINCLSKDPSRRPSVEDVLWHLQYSIQVQQTWTSSGNLGLYTGNVDLQK
ncbi:hypothetical protein Dimus_031364 [Dionaea muscipula]